MSLPTIAVEMSLSTNPMETPSWTDISAYVKEFSIKRGRQYELERMEAGTATLILVSASHRFDPENVLGDYYDTIWPMRKVRISVTWSGVTYRLFTGFVETWEPFWPDRKNQEVRVGLVDGFKILARANLNTSYSQEKVEVRIGNILNSISWTTGGNWVLDSSINSLLGTTTILAPNGDRALDDGVSTVQAITLANVSALQHLSDVLDTELGLAFIAGDGTFVFHGRHRLLKPPYTDAQATFSNVAGELGYADMVFSFDDQRIYNDVRVTRTGGAEQTASNAASQTKYGVRTLSQTDLLMTTDTEAKDRADLLCDHYRDIKDQVSGLPFMRVSSIILHPQGDDSLWPAALARELGDRVAVKRGSIIGRTQDHRLESIEHRYKPKYWESTFGLSPLDSREYWVLAGDPSGVYDAYSILGTTTRLAY